MGLRETIETNLKAALKQGDSVKLSTLRLLISAVKLFEIEKNIKTAEDGDIIQIIKRQIKERKESIEQFQKGNRQDLAEKEANEMKILEAYLPTQLSDEEVLAVVREAIAETGATSKADVGKVMKAALIKVKGGADGKTINQFVMKLLK